MSNASNSAQKRTLKPRQQKFVEEYLRCWNASEAARRAGYKTRANEAGRANMSNPDIRAFITNRIAETAMGADEVLQRLAQHARGSLACFVNDEGEIDLDSDDAKANYHLLKKAKVTHGTTKSGQPWTSTEIELHDPQAALVHIGRHLALFLDKSAGGDAVYREHMDQLRRAIVGDEHTEAKPAQGDEPGSGAVPAVAGGGASTQSN